LKTPAAIVFNRSKIFGTIVGIFAMSVVRKNTLRVGFLGFINALSIK
jgi:hypothetical protein